MSNDQKNSYICPICGNSVLENDNFCVNCGTKLTLYKACTQCGQTILSSDKYCIYCGSNQEDTILGRTKYKLINFNSTSLSKNKVKEVKKDVESKKNINALPAKIETEEKDNEISVDSNIGKQNNKKKKMIIISVISVIMIILISILFTRKINITYVDDEGTSNTNPTVYRFTDFKVKLKDVSKKGYTFKGWYIKEDNKTFALYSLGVDLLFDGDLTIYAVFEPIEYKITYEINGGLNSSSNPKTYTIESYVYLTGPTKNGYIFEGWYDENGNKVLAIVGSKQTGDLKLTAKWRKDYNGEYSYKVSTYNQSAIGSITITGDNVKVRDYPSTTYGNKIGLVHKGYSYNVYEKEYNDNYTWYKIGDSMWIPNDGSWVSYNQSSNNNCTATIKIKASMLPIRSSTTATVANEISTAKNGDIYDAYQIIYNEGYTWYKIGENAWIGDDGNQIITLQNHKSYNTQASYHALLVNIYGLNLSYNPSFDSGCYHEYSLGDVIYFGNSNNSIESVYADGYTWYHITNVAYAIDRSGNYIYSGEGWVPDENGTWVIFMQ